MQVMLNGCFIWLEMNLIKVIIFWGELESHKHLGEQHLVHCQDDGLTKIYVLKWSRNF